MTHPINKSNNEELSAEDRLKKDFKIFLRLLWKSLGLPKPTRAQIAIADYMQHGPRRRQIRAFRGLGKSWIAAAFALWRFYGDPDRKILVVSASKQRADDFTIFCHKCILEIEWLNFLAPQDDDQRWSRVSFDVRGAKPAQAPSMKSVGITGQIAGSRANDIIFDDVEIPGNSATDFMREKLLQLVQEGESVLIPKPDSTISFLGTPQTIFTIYKTLQDRAYTPFVWPARYPKKEKMVAYEGLLAPQLVSDYENGTAVEDAPTDTRFSSSELNERELSMSRSNFMLQFMLDTSLSDTLKFPLRLQDIPCVPLDTRVGPVRVVWRADKEHALDLPAVALPGDRWYRPAELGESEEWKDTIIAVDPSGRGRDETVAMILSQINGNIFLRRVFTSVDGYADSTLLGILEMCKRYGAKRGIIESNFGDGSVMEMLIKHGRETGIGVGWEESRASTSKEARIIDTLEIVLNQHRLVIDEAVAKWDYHSNEGLPPEERLPKMLMYQLTRMCREKGAVKFDDRVDCLALGVSYFQDVFAVSEGMEVERKRREEFELLNRALELYPRQALDRLVLGGGVESLRSLSQTGFSMEVR
jgi:hypothetical protein